MKGRRRDGSEFPLELSLTDWNMGEQVFFGYPARHYERKVVERKVRRINVELGVASSNRNSRGRTSSWQFAHRGHDLREPLRTVRAMWSSLRSLSRQARLRRW